MSHDIDIKGGDNVTKIKILKGGGSGRPRGELLIMYNDGVLGVMG